MVSQPTDRLPLYLGELRFVTAKSACSTDQFDIETLKQAYKLTCEQG